MDVEREDDLRRPPPTRAYEPVDRQLRVPAGALIATLDLLQRAGRRESGLFWYGERDSHGSGTVAFVVAPRQRMSWGNYHVSAEALAEVVQRLPPQWKPLSQVHSHPGPWVEHSRYDDQMVSSRRALSIVFPSYGQAGAPFPTGVGVHEWQNDYWYLLTLKQASRRLAVFEGTVRVEDYR
jgi:hypothetical protein